MGPYALGKWVQKADAEEKGTTEKAFNVNVQANVAYHECCHYCGIHIDKGGCLKLPKSYISLHLSLHLPAWLSVDWFFSGILERLLIRVRPLRLSLFQSKGAGFLGGGGTYRPGGTREKASIWAYLTNAKTPCMGLAIFLKNKATERY